MKNKLSTSYLYYNFIFFLERLDYLINITSFFFNSVIELDEELGEELTSYLNLNLWVTF